MGVDSLTKGFMPQNQAKNIITSEHVHRRLHTPGAVVDCVGLNPAASAYLITRIAHAQRRSVVVICNTEKEADQFEKDVYFFEPNAQTNLFRFRSYNIWPSRPLEFHNQVSADRIATLFQLMEPEGPAIVILTVAALLQKVVPKQALNAYVDLIGVGETCDRDQLVAKLLAGGYQSTAIVEEPGDFALRGGLLDVFTPLYAEPIRIEFFGDTIDTIKFFSAHTQRQQQPINDFILLPVREAILPDRNIEIVINRIRRQSLAQELPVTTTRQLVDQLKHEGNFPGLHGLIPLFYESLDTFWDYTAVDTLVCLTEPSALEQSAVKIENQVEANYASALEQQRLSIEPASMFLSWNETQNALATYAQLRLPSVDLDMAPDSDAQRRPRITPTVNGNDDIRMQLKDQKEQNALLQPLADWLIDHRTRKNQTTIVCGTRKQAQRLQQLLEPYELYLPIEQDSAKIHPSADSHAINIRIGALSKGFVWDEEALAVITEAEIFGTKKRVNRPRRKPTRAELVSFSDLKQDDLIVHIDHGIGRFEGLVKLRLDGVTNDFLMIAYRDADKLYLPVDRLNMIQKYLGVDGVAPVLDRMGGKAWERTKKKVKESADRIANELLKTFVLRKARKGYQFSEIDDYYQDFESRFAYEETPDQQNAINEILRDMRHPEPMDRLICGDVGYGKTEIAMRAAFLAVNSGKQVAVLVPTTVLAEQHMATFNERFERYAFHIACLSRFRNAAEQRQIVAQVKAGAIDIVIGTHRLLQKDVSFKDLGLIVIDEEQRFGVKHKEKLKRLRATVDVLALTATPIPRTLHLSLMGVRDISVISTPPQHRHSIITYLAEYDDNLVSDAIRRELARQGQVFFVHNNINTIDFMASKIQQLVPEVRLGVAHGRLDEDLLEDEMLRFVNREIDLLVCTTIIESGLDIPSANTILINRADRFGLAQIYQLRGRVGRSEDQAYAYLFVPKEGALGKEALKRLKVLMEHRDLGSGFQIAMRDLQIRGGGTILGASQSGHIAAVGYDLFLQLMEKAIAESKGERTPDPLEPEINLALSAFLPEAYIPNIDQRLLAYRRLSRLKDLAALNDFKSEMRDRFGSLPVEASNLLFKVMVRLLCIESGIRRLDQKGMALYLYFDANYLSNPQGLMRLIKKKPQRFQMNPDNVVKVTLSKEDKELSLAAKIKNSLKEIIHNVNN
jgi:transcription-repair coupling factor (superfamily II helicase)